MTSAPFPNQAALARLGQSVRQRLDAAPTAYRIPVDDAEVYCFADFLSAQECGQFMTRVDAAAAPSTIFDPENENPYRTSYSGNVNRDEPFVQMIERRLDDLMGIDPSFGETVQGQRYYEGQEYRGHFDWFDHEAPYWPSQEATGGQRSWTAMAYLNNVDDGGATDFPLLGVSVTPAQGMLLVWNNACPDGSPNRKTLHAATPVVRGVKYVITKWYRAQPWGRRSA